VYASTESLPVTQKLAKPYTRQDHPTSQARFQRDPTWLDSRCGRIVVPTDGASGIGAATVKLLHSKGAKVISAALANGDLKKS
jgi:hypothetical protein